MFKTYAKKGYQWQCKAVNDEPDDGTSSNWFKTRDVLLGTFLFAALLATGFRVYGYQNTWNIYLTANPPVNMNTLFQRGIRCRPIFLLSFPPDSYCHPRA